MALFTESHDIYFLKKLVEYIKVDNLGGSVLLILIVCWNNI